MRERLIAALPLDVRKGSAFPLSLFTNSGRLCLQSRSEAQPPNPSFTERRSLSAHQAAKPQVRIVKDSLRDIIASYDPHAPLAEASTIPSSWYTDARVYEIEQQTVFSGSWQVAARLDQVREPGQYVTTEIAGEPIVIVRGSDGELRGFFNVCRHHAAAVMTEAEGRATQLRCPYHGWTYSLEGALKGTPDFSGVCNFDRAENGLAPVEIATWEQWVFVRLKEKQTTSLNSPNYSLTEFLGTDLITQIEALRLEKLHWIERRRYSLNCNWKVFV